jgi:hypothetical protein
LAHLAFDHDEYGAHIFPCSFGYLSVFVIAAALADREAIIGQPGHSDEVAPALPQNHQASEDFA